MTAKEIMFGGDGSYQYIDDNIIGQVNQVSVLLQQKHITKRN